MGVQWRDIKFKDYEKAIKKCPPECLAGLGRMLHLGPITKLFGRADDSMFPMTEEEKVQWTVLPLQLAGLRSFDPVTRTYNAIDMRLGGAPPAEEEEWFAGVVRHLKSNVDGAPARDQTVLNLYETDLLCERFLKAIKECGPNKWSELVFKTKGVMQEEFV